MKDVLFKLDQAGRALRQMEGARSREQFYDSATLFLASTRAAVSVLAHKFGYCEFEKGEKIAGTNRHVALTQLERTKRERFDAWFRGASVAVLKSPLKSDRDAELHREGTSAIRFGLPPGSGLLLKPGNATDTPLTLRTTGAGRKVMSLPLCGPRPQDYYFAFDPSRPALELCHEYLQLVEALIEDAAPYT